MTKNIQQKVNLFTPFQESIDSYALPLRFTFPFYYDPHPLCLLAAKELQDHLTNQQEWEHNFGINPNKKGSPSGKMFGVLVVQNEAKEIGYLSAFSGKLADENHHKGFVPPVFDMLTEGSFFNVGIGELNEINRKTLELENSSRLSESKKLFEQEKALFAKQLNEEKLKIKAGKKARKLRRQKEKEVLSPLLFQGLLKKLAQESQIESIRFKHFSDDWKKRIEVAEKKFEAVFDEINFLKKERKEKSAALQQRLFQNYRFLNSKGEAKDLIDIFGNITPPAGSGECAAPKLLQYAFQNKLKPLAIAEFFWGIAPNSEIRQHRQFYPACSGKCKPILGHMLEGIEMDENPLLVNTAFGKTIEILYEDDHLLVINKPAEFLSVPGINIQDSVLARMQARFPDTQSPLIVHRLDMSTSGLMLIAKTKKAHKNLQYQFMKRIVKKQYIALLDGIVEGEEGLIDLPLRGDFDDRPRQLVCYEHGKFSQTKWKVIERKNGKTRIHFFPLTGRTHQLRMHAAHPRGLNMSIVGDDLYGTKSNRLHLHAEAIEFIHPKTRESMKIEVEVDF